MDWSKGKRGPVIKKGMRAEAGGIDTNGNPFKKLFWRLYKVPAVYGVPIGWGYTYYELGQVSFLMHIGFQLYWKTRIRKHKA